MAHPHEEDRAFSTGEIFEPEAPEGDDDPLQHALSEAARNMNRQGWAVLLRAHDHVWRDKQWDWRTRMEAATLLWSKAIVLCRENMLGRAA